MEYIYPFFIAFLLIFISELGDKTQLLVLSFSAKTKTIPILLGVALGSLFSHGLAIMFGGILGNTNNETINLTLKIITYISFIIFGIISIIPKKEKESNQKSNILKKISMLSLNYILIIAFSIAIGELGDKTFLASIGLGIQYTNTKLSLILGCICGMVASDSIAIVIGKLLQKKISQKAMNNLSGILFLIFGIIGLLSNWGRFFFGHFVHIQKTINRGNICIV